MYLVGMVPPQASGGPALDLRLLITQMLEWDPRPTSQRRAMPVDSSDSQGRNFAFRILDFDVHWQIRDQTMMVLDLIQL